MLETSLTRFVSLWMTLRPKNKVLLLKPAGKCMTNFSVSDGGIGEVRFPTSMSLALRFEVSSMEYRNCLCAEADIIR